MDMKHQKKRRHWYLTEDGKPFDSKLLTPIIEKVEIPKVYDFTFLDDITYKGARKYLRSYMNTTFKYINYDAIDDVILIACEKAHMYDKEKAGKFVWMAAILRNYVLGDYKKKKKLIALTDGSINIIIDDIEAEQMENEVLFKKREIANLIKDKEEFPYLHMLLIEFKSYKEIETEYEINPSTCKSRIKRERDILKKMLKLALYENRYK